MDYIIYTHLKSSGCGQTKYILKLNNDRTFELTYDDNWMGREKCFLKLTGKYQNNNNNYYFLLSNRISDQKESLNMIEIDNFIIELVLLNQPEKLHHFDRDEEIIILAYGGIFNNYDSVFDAILCPNLSKNQIATENINLLVTKMFPATTSVLKFSKS